MAGVILLLLARQRMPGRARELFLIAGAFGFLLLSTSRQASVGLAAGAAMLALLPAGRQARFAAAAVSAFALVVVIAAGQVPAAPSGGDDPGVPLPPPIPGVGVQLPATPPPATPVVRGSSQLSMDPNRNFRLYLNLVLVPWVIQTDPLIGLGPGAHLDKSASPLLIEKVEADGVDWSFARRFMNDSNYATLLVQFGLPASLLFLGLYAVPAAIVLIRLRRTAHPVAAFALALGVAMAIAAAFGPAFELRTASSVAWVSIFTALALVLAEPRQPVPPEGAIER
jgi:hypothetical protein